MTFSTSHMFEALAKRDDRGPGLSVSRARGQVMARPARPGTAPNGASVAKFFPDPAPHPTADRIAGRPIKEQVSVILTDRCHFLGQNPSRRVMQDRCDRVVTTYAELRGLGFEITEVTTFGLRHARALLSSWKERGLAKKTIYNRWSLLRTWALALNKHGMLGPIDELWPGFSDVADKTPGRRVLSPEQLKTRSAYLQSKSDQTAYLVDRLSREVGLTRVEALELDLTGAQSVTADHDILRTGVGASVRTYIGMAVHRELFTEAALFMTARGRSKLGWPDMDIQDALTKYTDRMVYVTKTLFPQEKKGGAE